MSTRAGIIIKDKYDQIHFYRHSDGYPEGTLPALEKFLSWVKEGKICNNVQQSAGWLIVIGAMEYATLPPAPVNTAKYGSNVKIEDIPAPADWKVGAFEPTVSVERHGDLEYIYTVDLDKMEITHREA